MLPKPRVLYQKPRRPKPRPIPPQAPAPIPLPAPFRCAVRCPACRAEASWLNPVTSCGAPIDPATIRGKPIIQPVSDSHWCHVWHFPSLIPPPGPESTRPIFSLHRFSLYRRDYDPHAAGVRACDHCRTLEVAALDWPRSAYFQITLKRSTLFARDRADWSTFRTYIAASNRRALARSSEAYLLTRYLPRAFIIATNRAAVLKAMDAIR